METSKAASVLNPPVALTQFGADSPEHRRVIAEEVLRRIVAYYNPLRVYLFGSEVRGEARLDSDLDFLVVLADAAPRENWLDGGIHARLGGIPLAIDVITVREAWYRDHENCWASIAGIVAEEGRLLYEDLH